MKTKPVRYYRKLLVEPVAGEEALLELYNDDPDHETKALGEIRIVHTTIVIRDMDDEGQFETFNSIYRPHATKP